MNTQTKVAIIAIAVVITLASLAVSQTNFNFETSTSDDSKLQLVTSASFLHEFSQNIGKEKINSTLLVPMGINPHDWEPTIRDTEKLEKSDMIIINGLGYENWVDSLELSNLQGVIVDTSNGIAIEHDDEHEKEDEHDGHEKEDEHDGHEKEDERDEHDHGGQDPHIWLNPVYAQLQAKNIANALSNSDPTNKNYYQSNAEMYIKELDSLDSKIRTELSGCRTDFITFHNAFSYFAEEYGLTQHTIVASTDPHGDVTPKTLEKIISTAKKLNIKVIFAEESTSIKTSQVIADEIGGKVLVLSPLEVVSDEEDYVSKMTQNLENLREALC